MSRLKTWQSSSSSFSSVRIKYNVKYRNHPKGWFFSAQKQVKKIVQRYKKLRERDKAHKAERAETDRQLNNAYANEKEFVKEFANKNYRPELLFEDKEILERISAHPMALWRVRENN